MPKAVLCIVVFFVVGCATAWGQFDRYSENNPLKPDRGEKYRGYLGLLLGGGPNIQSGGLRVECPDCLFDNGRGTGFMAALTYDHYFSTTMSVGAMLSYDHYSFAAQYRETQIKELVSPSLGNGATERVIELPVELQQRAEIALGLFSITPFIRYRPLEWISLRAGFTTSLGTPSLSHRESLTREVYVFDGSIYVARLLDGDGGVKMEAVEPPGSSSVSFAADLGLTFHFWVRYDVFLVAAVDWRQPFSTYDFYGSDFQIYGPRISLGAEYLIYRVLR